MTVSGTQPNIGSAHTTWPARVVGLTSQGDQIRLDVDRPPSAHMDVTPSVVAELALRRGSTVRLSVAAFDLQVYPVAEPGG